MSRGRGCKGNQPKGQAHLTNVEEPRRESHSAEVGGFNSEEIKRLRNLLKTLEKPSGSCSLAQNGNNLNSYVFSASNKYNSNTWFIDLGATDHMIHLADYFTTYQPCPNKKIKIKVAGGSLITVVGQGTVAISSSFILKNVLHVPNLAVNLSSIHKITRDLNCHVTISNDHCILQDQTMGRMIGQARASEGHSDPLSLSLISINSNKDGI